MTPAATGADTVFVSPSEQSRTRSQDKQQQPSVPSSYAGWEKER